VKQKLLFFLFACSGLALCAQNSIVVAFPDTAREHFSYDGIIDHAGNYVIPSLRGDVGDPNCYATISKFDPWFGHEWSVVTDQKDLPTRILQTSDNNYLVLGGSMGVASLMKIDQSGNVMWLKAYSSVFSFFDMLELSNGDLVVTARILNGGCILRLDAQGTIVWMKKYNDNLGAGEIYPNKILQTIDGKLAVTGYINISLTQPDKFFIMKITNQGTPIWSKVYQSSATSFWPYSFVQNPADGSYLVCGSTVVPLGANQQEATLFKMDSTGGMLLNKTLGYAFDDRFYDITPAGEGHYMLIGLTEPVVNCGGNMFFTKINADLDTIFTRTYGTSSGNGTFFPHIRQTSDGGFHSFGTGSLWAYIPEQEIIYLKVDSLANGACHPYSQVLTEDTLQWNLVGTIVSTSSSTPVATTYTVSSCTLYAVNSCTGLLLSAGAPAEKAEAKLFPNPAIEKITIALEGAGRSSSLLITSAQGRRVLEAEMNSSSFEINTSEYPAGIYFYRIRERSGKEYAGRFCVVK